MNLVFNCSKKFFLEVDTFSICDLAIRLDICKNVYKAGHRIFVRQQSLLFYFTTELSSKVY